MGVHYKLLNSTLDQKIKAPAWMRRYPRRWRREGSVPKKMKKSLEEILGMLGEAGLTVEIVGLTAVAGLLSSEALRDPRSDHDVAADEAFEFFDVDGNGVIQKGG